jgi:hypothetical protein
MSVWGIDGTRHCDSCWSAQATTRRKVKGCWYSLCAKCARVVDEQRKATEGKPVIECNAKAYPFEYDLNDGKPENWGKTEWRVWRPDRCPHHFGHYKTKERAQASADRINKALGIEE